MVIEIFCDFLFVDGCFGCGFLKVCLVQFEVLVFLGVLIFGILYCQVLVKNFVGSVCEQFVVLFWILEGYEIVFGNGGFIVFWDVVVFGLIECCSQNFVFGEFGGKFVVVVGVFWLEVFDVCKVELGLVIVVEVVLGVDVYVWLYNEILIGVVVFV